MHRNVCHTVKTKAKLNSDESVSSWWLCFSVKFVGLFVILLIGVGSIVELWLMIGDRSMPVVSCFLVLYKTASDYEIFKN